MMFYQLSGCHLAQSSGLIKLTLILTVVQFHREVYYMLKALGSKPLLKLMLLTHDILQELVLPYARDLPVLGVHMHDT